MIHKIFMCVIECLRIIIIVGLCIGIGCLIVDDLIYDLDFIPGTSVDTP